MELFNENLKLQMELSNLKNIEKENKKLKKREKDLVFAFVKLLTPQELTDYLIQLKILKRDYLTNKISEVKK